MGPQNMGDMVPVSRNTDNAYAQLAHSARGCKAWGLNIEVPAQL